MKRKKLLLTLTAVIVTVTAVCVLIWRQSVPMRLVLSDQVTGRVYARYEVEEGDEFSVTFRHSVNKSNVSEIYEIRDGKIVQTGCDYYDFGAGVAEVLDPSWTLEISEDGVMKLRNLNLPMNDMTYIVGTVYDHILNIHGEDIVLNELCGRNTKVHFEIR